MPKKGMLIVLSGPSGVGKGTVRKALFNQSDVDFKYSISMTTRKPRPGEVNGKDYFFVTKDQFKQNIKDGKMLEYAQYVDNYYGTPFPYVKKMLNEGHDVFLEIEVNGAMQVRSMCPGAVFIFLTPPSLKALKARLVGRGTESMTVINERIHRAVTELKLMRNYDYAVLNDKVPSAVRRIRQIIASERLRVPRVLHHYMKKLGDDRHC